MGAVSVLFLVLSVIELFLCVFTEKECFYEVLRDRENINPRYSVDYTTLIGGSNKIKGRLSLSNETESEAGRDATCTMSISAQDGGIKIYIEDEDNPKKRYRCNYECHNSNNPEFIYARQEGKDDICGCFKLCIDGNNITIRIKYHPFVISISRERDGEVFEVFRINRDNKLYLSKKEGHVGLDFDFIGNYTLTGIPSHADDFILSPTANHMSNEDSSPYRLFNRDPGEYNIRSKSSIYGSVPFVLGLDEKGESLGLFWMNPSETFVDITCNNIGGEMFSSTHWMSRSGSIEVYLFVGPRPKDVLRQYTSVTGRTILPPMFSLGYHQSKWGYNDSEQVRYILNEFQKHDVPLDAIWLDLEYSNGKRYLTWSPDFPDPLSLVEDIVSVGKKLFIIVDPHIKEDKGYKIYEDSLKRDIFVKYKNSIFRGDCWPGMSSWIDFSNPKAIEYWKEIFSVKNYSASFLPKSNGKNHNTLKNIHVWNDMNEPCVFNIEGMTFPKDVTLYGGWKDMDIHNMYGLFFHRATRDALVERNNARVLVLSRSFFAGTQTVGPVWTGDNSSTWEHLELSISMALSHSISGICFMGADIGGFFGNPDPELLVRWYQAGIFITFYRSHCHIDSDYREPYLQEPYILELIRNAIYDRYVLISYIYTLFFVGHKDGQPVMRPLFFEFPEDRNCHRIENQLMFGSSLLIKPITKAGLNVTKIYFPTYNQIEWYDYYDHRRVCRDGGYIDYDISLDRIPVFVKDGSIIPKRNIHRLSTSSMTNDPYSLLVVLNRRGSAEGQLYIDDGESFDYLKRGKYQYRGIKAGIANNILTINSYLKDGDPEYKHVSKYIKDKNRVFGRIDRITILGLKDGVRGLKMMDKGLDLNVDPIFEKRVNSDVDNRFFEIKLPELSVDEDWSIKIKLQL